MRNIVWKFTFIILLLGLAAYSVWPPKEKIRLGKDLAGGTSLIYEVQMPENTSDREGLINQVIDVLKDRVNPKGVMDISIQPIGLDRIEIVMPLPGKDVLQLRRVYEEKLAQLLREAYVPKRDLAAALLQGTATAQFKLQGVDTLQQTFDLLVEQEKKLQDAKDAGVVPAELRRFEAAVAEAELAYEDAREAVLSLSIDEQRIRHALQLSTKKEPQLDEKNEVVEDEDGKPVFRKSLRELALEKIKDQFPHITQRLDETVAAFDAYVDKRRGFDDPDDLIRLLRGAGVLEFHIAVEVATADENGVNIDDLRTQLEERGPNNIDSLTARWFEVNDLKQWAREAEDFVRAQEDPIAYFALRGLVAAQRDGTIYLLLYTTEEKSLTHDRDDKWSLVQAQRGQDQLGRVAVTFNLDDPGGALMGKLTGGNVGKPMAIVLDGQVYTAPNINSQISKSGIIQGRFSEKEIAYLIKVLSAGSLEAQISESPIAVNTLGPSIGADNLSRGLWACVIAIIAVAAFMIFYYFFAGIVAVTALMANGILIFGAMTWIHGTFTLPGLAGIVLTIGMAVDANVLIYERIREELFTGEVDLRGAVRLGYAKALSTIIDANVTNLIVCAVLYQTATAEVKGFALTLAIGIFATLFTALFVTRAIFTVYAEGLKIRKLPMLATVVPAIHRALEPNINWIGMRKIFWGVSAIAVAGSLSLVFVRGVEMLDTEFRGGVAATIEMRAVDADEDGAPDVDENGDVIRQTLPHTGPDGVETVLHAYAEAEAAKETDGRRRAILQELAKATVLTVGEASTVNDIAHATSFQIKVANPKGLAEDDTIQKDVTEILLDIFGDKLDATLPLKFTGSENTSETAYAHYTYEIDKDNLGAVIERSGLKAPVDEYMGGLAIVVDNVVPATTERDVATRLDRIRNQPDFSDAIGRKVEVIGLDPTGAIGSQTTYSSFAVLVSDPHLSILTVDSALWSQDLAKREWELVTTALKSSQSLKQVGVFSPAIAQTLSAQAIVAVVLSVLCILLYIWIRFGSLRYSIAAIVALVHDVCLALGLLALSQIIGKSMPGTLLIEPFLIDLGVIAALLTIIGYSLNDTIVILDRIRENRGKLPLASASVINRSINQTVSRTVLTSFTTLLAILIMYIEGGSGIRPFTYCLLAGLIVGTYSSVAIAAPLVVKGGDADRSVSNEEDASADTARLPQPTTA